LLRAPEVVCFMTEILWRAVPPLRCFTPLSHLFHPPA